MKSPEGRSVLTASELVRRRRASARAARRWRFAAAAGLLACAAALLLVTRSARTPAAPAARRAAPSASAQRPRPTRRTRTTREATAIAATARRMPYVSVAGHGRREIALTFDDGPGPYTRTIVRELRHRHAPATFFQVGSMIAEFPAAERALIADTQVVLGDHTETHPMLPRLSASAQYQQISDEAGMQRLHGAPSPRRFRPPYGAIDRTTEQATRRLGLLDVLWSVDSQDYMQPGVAAIVSRVMAGAHPGAIVLLHDAGGTRTQTVQALPIIIRRLRKAHYRLVTIPRLLLDDRPSAHQPPRVVGAG
ncbi:MAG: polysaccharide deacetylase family protein [Solirubrobacteraceae bacterium]